MSANDRLIRAMMDLDKNMSWPAAEKMLALVRRSDPQYERYRDIKDAAIRDKDRLCDAILACEPEYKLYEMAKALRTPF